MIAPGALQDDGARAVAEEHAGVPVGPVDVPRQDLAADDEDVLGLARLDQAVGEVEGVEKPDTGRAHVGRRRPGRAEVALDEAGGRRKGHVARDRSHEDHVQVLGLHARAFQRLLRRPGAEVGEVLPLGDDVALLDPGARHDPLVRRVDELLQVRVGQELLRDGRSGPDHHRPIHAFASRSSRAWSSAICAWIFWARLRRENSAAKRMAFLIAFAEERPWQMMTQPFTPRSGAPPYSE